VEAGCNGTERFGKRIFNSLNTFPKPSVAGAQRLKNAGNSGVKLNALKVLTITSPAPQHDQRDGLNHIRPHFAGRGLRLAPARQR
jgi:hypothetical protein